MARRWTNSWNCFPVLTARRRCDSTNAKGVAESAQILRWSNERSCGKLAQMKLPELTAVIEPEGEWFVATCPELGVVSQGHTMDEAERMIKEAVDLLLEDA